MRNNLAYMRMRTAIVAIAIHNVRVKIISLFRLGGLSKFGSTPEGGGLADPFKRAWILAADCSDVTGPVEVAIAGDVWMWMALDYRIAGRKLVRSKESQRRGRNLRE